MNSLVSLVNLLPTKIKRKIYVISCSAAIIAILEALVLLSIYMLLGPIIDPSIFDKRIADLSIYVKFTSTTEYFVIVATLAVSLTVAAGLGKYIYLREQKSTLLAVTKFIINNLYYGWHSKNYRAIINNKNSEIISTLTSKTTILAFEIFIPSFAIVLSSLSLIVIIMLLAIVNLEITVLVVSLIALFYFFVVKQLKNRIKECGVIINSNLSELVEDLKNSHLVMKNIILDDLLIYFQERFVNKEQSLRSAQLDVYLYGSLPKVLLESLMFICIGIAVLITSISDNYSSVQLSIYALFGLAAQKLIPAAHSVYVNLNTIRSNTPIIDYFIEQINITPILTQNIVEIDYENSINLTNIEFSYSNHTDAITYLKFPDIVIKKGALIGIRGKSGTGKTTLSDIVLGLLIPNKGEMTIDNLVINENNIQSWWRCVSNVPQNISILSATVAENIALGVSFVDIEMSKLKAAAKFSLLDEFVSKLPYEYSTVIGEGGYGLSGGEKQRLSIARALYKGASLIVMDEPSSALDGQTEGELIETLLKLRGQVTIVVISHSISLLKACDYTIEL